MTQLLLATKQVAQFIEPVDKLSIQLKTLAVNSIDAAGLDPVVFAITIFILACFVGYYVVWKVTPALHTPLMSITNAISGIIIIGSMIAASPADFSLATILGYVATFLAAINIFGGFIVTERMLKMFKKIKVK